MYLLDLFELLNPLQDCPDFRCFFLVHQEERYLSSVEESYLFGCGCVDGASCYFSETPLEITFKRFFDLLNSIKIECMTKEGKVHSHHVLSATCNFYDIFKDQNNQEELLQELSLREIRKDFSSKQIIFFFEEEGEPF